MPTSDKLTENEVKVLKAIDHGGSTDDFRRVTKAREVLGV